MVGTKREVNASSLAKIGLTDKADLVTYFPLRYEDETKVSSCANLRPSQHVVLEVRVIKVDVTFRPRKQLSVWVTDGASSVRLRFLHYFSGQPRVFEKFLGDETLLRVFGEVRLGYEGYELIHPRYAVADVSKPLSETLTPVYSTVAGLSQRTIRTWVGQALQQITLHEILPQTWLDQHGFSPLRDAVLQLHLPDANADLAALNRRTHPAWRRIKFDELLAQQLSLKRFQCAREDECAIAISTAGTLAKVLCEQLSFTLTHAQLRVGLEIKDDLSRHFPMHRLLQGDVGSGKTVVAALAACHVLEAGWQVALMAPTEILAEQLYAKLKVWFSAVGVTVVSLTGSHRKAERQVTLSVLNDGSPCLVIGTHALIQESVNYARLGLVIVDEQHRFGVAQRLELRRKGALGGTAPHQLMMSATPIPRTLAMSYYADLDVSVLDSLPPGRTPIRTRLVSDTRRVEVVARIAASVSAGRQVYWVCPLIEESDKLELQAALDTFTSLQADLPNLRIGLVHGRMKPDEKAAVMAGFVAGQVDVLVATTVIEVGVDVPNASLMVIEHAERFGLSQLHQLRGRVGRGVHESVCVLLFHEPLSQTAKARLKVIYENTDGFEIARQDLALRGPGEFIGSRQSGVPMLRYASLEEDEDLIELAREMADYLLRNSPAVVDQHLARWLGFRQELLRA